jgi:hypothetical protein
MPPALTVNHVAVFLCVLLAMPLGFLWFGPLFGRTWLRQMGMEHVPPPGGAAMAKSTLIYAGGSLLMAYVLAHSLEIWRPSTWQIGPDAAPWVYALNGAFWNWLGFFLPLQMGRVAWEQRGWGLVAINAGFDATRLLLFACILSYWR